MYRNTIPSQYGVPHPSTTLILQFITRRLLPVAQLSPPAPSRLELGWLWEPFGAAAAVGADTDGVCGWGRGNNVVINNNFISSNHFNRVNVGNNNNWVHNPAHRGGVPYNNRNVANRYQGAGRNAATRPTVGQTQQRLNQTAIGQRGGGAIGKQGPGNFGQRGGVGMPTQGNASRIGGARRRRRYRPARAGQPDSALAVVCLPRVVRAV